MITISRACWAINKQSVRFWTERCRVFELGPGQVPLLSLLHRKENITQEEITRYLSIDKAAVAKSVAKLLTLGFIERTDDPNDARAWRICLTAKGHEVEPFLSSLELEWDSILMKGFSDEEKKLARNLVSRMQSNAFSGKT